MVGTVEVGRLAPGGFSGLFEPALAHGHAVVQNEGGQVEQQTEPHDRHASEVAVGHCRRDERRQGCGQRQGGQVAGEQEGKGITDGPDAE
jgi:hypothetical protein